MDESVLLSWILIWLETALWGGIGTCEWPGKIRSMGKIKGQFPSDFYISQAWQILRGSI